MYIRILRYTKKGGITIENSIEKINYLEAKSEILKALANPIRLCILNCLANSGDCNVTTLANSLGQRQSTVSQHLSKLKAMGIVTSRRSKQEINYSITNEEYLDLITYILKDIPK